MVPLVIPLLDLVYLVCPYTAHPSTGLPRSGALPRHIVRMISEIVRVAVHQRDGVRRFTRNGLGAQQEWVRISRESRQLSSNDIG
jgi:hypothetical protein